MSLNLDLTGAQETGTPIPDGTYPVILNKAEVSPTKSGGTMIKIQLKVIDGPQAGRVIFDQFNIENANPKAVQIGLGQLKGMMKTFGHPNFNMLKTTEELLGLKGMVAVKTIDDDTYGLQTRVKAYKPLTQNGTIAPAQSAVNGAAQPAAANPFA